MFKALTNLFFRQKQTDVFNPNGFESLLNEELQQAIEAVTQSNTSTHRQQLYRVLLETTFCLPSLEAEEGTSQITAAQNEAGERVLPAFTDPIALRRWLPNPKSMLVMPAPQLFELAIENDFSEILINPAGPSGGRLAKHEFVRLAQGVLPE